MEIVMADTPAAEASARQVTATQVTRIESQEPSEIWGSG